MNPQKLRQIIEAALLTFDEPLSIDNLLKLFTDDDRPGRDQVRAVLDEVEADCAGRGYELKQVNSGYRFQARQELAPWISRLWDERPMKYSRALLETLALIAYRQPTTRAEIEDIRGVSVSSNIIKTLMEREWIRIVGHREVPGRPALYGTTRKMLDYFNLKSLEELPPLSELMDLDQAHERLRHNEEYGEPEFTEHESASGSSDDSDHNGDTNNSSKDFPDDLPMREDSKAAGSKSDRLTATN